MDLHSRPTRHPARRFDVSGFRAVAAGVVLYTAGRAAFKRLFAPEAVEEQEPEAPPLRPKRKAQRGAGEKGAPPSLELPQHRWPRLPASRR